MTKRARESRVLSRRLMVVSAVICGLMLGGCSLKQDMAMQPKNRPLSPSDFFPDGRSERPILENTVARGSIAEDALYVGKDSNTFPLPVTQELMERGQERFKIFCSPCHGLQGDGNGMIVMRGMKRPPSYHESRLRQVPNGYIFDVITNGFGAMMNYSAQIPVRDRWAIVAYVRALQLSRNAKMADLPPDVREKVLHPPADSKEAPGGEEKPGGAKE
jgi:mono/diheme cytochrome c family protein